MDQPSGIGAEFDTVGFTHEGRTTMCFAKVPARVVIHEVPDCIPASSRSRAG
jgi:hypothetical protein